MAQASPAAADAPPALVSGYDAFVFDLILDDSGDVDFALLDGHAPPVDDVTDSSAESSSGREDAAVAQPQDDEASSTTASAGPRAKRRRVTQAQRVRAEKKFLEEQIVELQQQLTDAMVATAIASCNTRPSAWRAAAKRQLTRRCAAEKENERLRAKLRRQLQVAKSLEVVIANRSTEFFEQLEPRPFLQIWPIRAALDGDLERVFQQFAQDIQRAYEVIDSVIPSPDVDSDLPVSERPDSKATVKSHFQDGVEQLYVEMRHSYVMPFSLDQVKRVFPIAATTEIARQNREIERYMATKEVYASKFLVHPEEVVTRFGDEETGTVLAQIYYEADRVVTIWRGFMSTRNSGYSQALGVSTGWTVFRPMPNIPDHVAVHVCCRNVPLRSEIIPKTSTSLAHMPEEAPEVGAFTTHLLCTAGDIIPNVTDSMENLLLEEAIQADTIKLKTR